MTFTVPLADFRLIAEIAGKSAGTDKFTPALTYIRFRTSGGVLSATATDRYTISTARVGVENAPDVEFFLTVPECAAIWRTFNPARAARVEVRVTVKADGISVSRESGLLRVGGDATLSFKVPNFGEWPSGSVDPLITRTARGNATKAPPLNTAYIRRLPAGTCEVRTSESIYGFFAESWAVLIMGMRMSNDWSKAVLAGWSA